MEKQKVIVYVDGFNFYYGLKGDPKWKRYYWLDIVKFFELFMRPAEIRKKHPKECGKVDLFATFPHSLEYFS